MVVLLACLYYLYRLPDTTTSSHAIRSVADAPDPCAVRAVSDVLWSCLATTFAVTWVSVHPNVPVLDESAGSVRRRRLFLMLLALIAPEIMILWAFKQWCGARAIARIINDARPESVTPWTLVHAHFLQMGGFRLVCTKAENIEGPIDSALSETVTPAGPRRLKAWGRFFIPYYFAFQSALGPDFVEGALSFDALLALLEDGRIDLPDLSAEDILDKSKGDALSKGFALLQISWFLLQVVARACAGLVVTELELTTAILAGMNAVTYFFWWSKPVDVRCPLVVRTRAVEDVMHARLMQDVQHWRFRPQREARDEDSSSAISTTVGEDEEHLRPRSALRSSVSTFLSKVASPVSHRIRAAVNSLRRAPVARLPQAHSRERRYPPLGSRQRSRPRRALRWVGAHLLRPPTHLLGLLISAPANTLLEHGLWTIGAAAEDHSVAHEFYLEHYADARHKLRTKPARALLMHAADMRWVMFMLFHSERPQPPPPRAAAAAAASASAADPRRLFYAGASAGLAFGALHCIAWGFPFPSAAERTAWRAAALLICALCLVVLAGAHAYRLAHAAFWRGSDASRACLIAMLVLQMLSAIPCTLYPLARIALLLVALTSLRGLSESALQTVQWTRFIPHI